MSKGLPRLVANHVKKARESALLAVDVYNRPTASFRTCAYIVLMQIAWTSLLLGIFERRQMKPYYRKGKRFIRINGELKRWELQKLVEVYWKDTLSPVAKNLEFMNQLRNKIEHRDVPELDPRVFGECQSMIFNFEDVLEKEFGPNYGIADTLVIPVQLSRMRLIEKDNALRYSLKPLPDDVGRFVDAFRSSLSTDIWTDLAYSYRVFLVPNVGNNPTKESIPVEFVKLDSKDVETQAKLMAIIKEKRVNVANYGQFKPGQVVVEVKKGLDPRIRFNMTIHTRSWAYFEARPPSRGPSPEKCKTEFCIYDAVHRDYVYTQNWIDFLVKELSDPEMYQKVSGFVGRT